jgi:hypothetical protein
MALRSCDSSTRASSSSGLMRLEAAIYLSAVSPIPQRIIPRDSKRAGPRLNMGDANEIVFPYVRGYVDALKDALSARIS